MALFIVKVLYATRTKMNMTHDQYGIMSQAIECFTIFLILSTILNSNTVRAQLPDNKMHTLSSQDILGLLPVGSKLADDIPLNIEVEGNRETVTKYKDPVIYADVDGDGQNEVVVAYYTPPLNYSHNGVENPGFYERAHVCVLHRNGTQFIKQWDSGGYGASFTASLNYSEVLQSVNGYLNNLLNVSDVTGDGIPAILATRFTFGSKNSSVLNVWHWNGYTYKQIAETNACRFITRNGRVQLFTRPAYTDLVISDTLCWDAGIGKFVEEIDYTPESGRHSPQLFIQDFSTTAGLRYLPKE